MHSKTQHLPSLKTASSCTGENFLGPSSDNQTHRNWLKFLELVWQNPRWNTTCPQYTVSPCLNFWDPCSSSCAKEPLLLPNYWPRTLTHTHVLLKLLPSTLCLWVVTNSDDLSYLGPRIHRWPVHHLAWLPSVLLDSSNVLEILPSVVCLRILVILLLFWKNFDLYKLFLENSYKTLNYDSFCLLPFTKLMTSNQQSMVSHQASTWNKCLVPRISTTMFQNNQMKDYDSTSMTNIISYTFQRKASHGWCRAEVVVRKEGTVGPCSLRNLAPFIIGHSNFFPRFSLGLSTNNNHRHHIAPYNSGSDYESQNNTCLP
jgi:hypothetical protein